SHARRCVEMSELPCSHITRIAFEWFKLNSDCSKLTEGSRSCLVAGVEEDGPLSGVGDVEDSLMLPRIVRVDCVSCFGRFDVRHYQRAGAFGYERAGH